MAKEIFYVFNIKEGERGDDSEAFIKAKLERKEILKWAYILHDKEVYNEHDMASRRFGVNYCWADGFQGQEKYSSVDEYLEEQMSKPPFIGDKMDARWHIIVSTDKSMGRKDIAEWFGMPHEYYLRTLDTASCIKDALESLTNEDSSSVAFERPRYSDEDVRSNFDVREYISNIRISPAKSWWEKFWPPIIFNRGRKDDNK